MMVVIRLSQNLQKTTLPTKHPPNRGQNLRFRGPDSLRTATPPLKRKTYRSFQSKKSHNFVDLKITKQINYLNYTIYKYPPPLRGVRQCRMGVFCMNFTVSINSFIAVSTSLNHIYSDFYLTGLCSKRKPQVAYTSITLQVSRLVRTYTVFHASRDTFFPICVIELNTEKSPGGSRAASSCLLVKFLAFNSAFGRHRH